MYNNHTYISVLCIIVVNKLLSSPLCFLRLWPAPTVYNNFICCCAAGGEPQLYSFVTPCFHMGNATLIWC